MASPHVLVLPFPAQGHVIPLMELSHLLVAEGFKITFVNTDFNHDRVVAALLNEGGDEEEDLRGIRLVSVPDGLEPGEDRNNLVRLVEGFTTTMAKHLEELIRENPESDDEEEKKMTWIVADATMGWSFALAKRMGLRVAVFNPASAGLLWVTLSIPKMIEDGVINDEGLPIKQEIFQLKPGMPPMSTLEFPWNYAGDAEVQKTVYRYVVHNNQAVNPAEIIVSNSFHELESSTFTHFPKILPIGPLLAGELFEKPIGLFWHEDLTCMTWLDEQQSNSVVYVAFGSLTIFDQVQFQELAQGLELSGRPFLWVVRPDFTNQSSQDWLERFRARVSGQGRIVSWSPQQKVLAHPSIACFLSHCGWNSTMEGVRNGVPFLCWPYFSDQFFNQSYICNVWKIGLKMIPDSKGIITREQVKGKVEELLRDEEMKKRASMWKEISGRSIKEGGSSYENFQKFVKMMRA
ncbi:UDP-glycosyltransferase 83A1-like [Typha angustifolia]|uniref:UDP-glycosyltransferase 83A1-like n=1 Tax=Typha angustifolia TaxID=59011 RepID=UPI003C2E82D8